MFASPHATKIYKHFNSEAVEKLPYNGLHEQIPMSAQEFDNGVTWLIHFGYVQKIVEHGRVMLERLK